VGSSVIHPPVVRLLVSFFYHGKSPFPLKSLKSPWLIRRGRNDDIENMHCRTDGLHRYFSFHFLWIISVEPLIMHRKCTADALKNKIKNQRLFKNPFFNGIFLISWKVIQICIYLSEFCLYFCQINAKLKSWKDRSSTSYNKQKSFVLDYQHFYMYRYPLNENMVK
jgi:hypothetical protein